VGSGQVAVEETGEGAQARRALFFTTGSDPKRAHELARLGWMREVTHAPEPMPAETGYFGVLTSSPEESLDSARKSVTAPPKGRSALANSSFRRMPRGRTRGSKSDPLSKPEGT
jgi:hypothetical protein